MTPEPKHQSRFLWHDRQVRRSSPFRFVIRCLLAGAILGVLLAPLASFQKSRFSIGSANETGAYCLADADGVIEASGIRNSICQLAELTPLNLAPSSLGHLSPFATPLPDGQETSLRWAFALGAALPTVPSINVFLGLRASSDVCSANSPVVTLHSAGIRIQI